MPGRGFGGGVSLAWRSTTSGADVAAEAPHLGDRAASEPIRSRESSPRALGSTSGVTSTPARHGGVEPQVLGSASGITSNPLARSRRLYRRAMEWEDPAALLGRLRLGREEFLQRLLTTLIVGGTYPRWNTRSTPTPQGAHFLRRLDELSFEQAAPAGPQVFIDELELKPRTESEPGGAPDWAVLSQNRLWLIELKTEAASHRPHQIPYYFQLGAHHFPEHTVDVTYITGPLMKPAPGTDERHRYAHVRWESVLPLVAETWGEDRRPEVRRLVDVVQDAGSSLDERWADWRGRFTGHDHRSVEPSSGCRRPSRTHRGHRGRRRAAGARLAGGVARAPARPAARGSRAHPRLARGERHPVTSCRGSGAARSRARASR